MFIPAQMLSLKRLKHSKAGRNFGASIFALISTSAFGLLSIQVAVHYMSKEEIGLWAAVNAMAAYLMMMDLGVGNAAERVLALDTDPDLEVAGIRWRYATRLRYCTR